MKRDLNHSVNFSRGINMPSRAKKVDDNQAEIVKALRACGVSIQDTSAVGKGFPDLVISYQGRNHLVEIKNPEARGKQNPRQMKFMTEWNAKIHIVTNVSEALAVIGGKVQ